jgi:hypothetical protein
MMPAAKIDAALSLFLHTAYYAKNFIHNYMDKVQEKMLERKEGITVHKDTHRPQQPN